MAAPVPWTPWPLPRLSERWARYAAVPDRHEDHGALILRPRYLALPKEPSWARPEWQIALAVRRVVRGLPPPDLMHAHFAMPMGGAARYLSGWLKIPYVLSLHGSDMNVWPLLHPGRLEELRVVIAQAARVTAVSDELAAKAYALSGTRPDVLPIGIDRNTFRLNMRPKDDARRVLGLAPEAFIVLFVGNLLPEKGVRELVDAVVTLGEPFHAVLVGRGPLHRYGVERTTTTAASRISYPGAKTNPEVALYMSASDALILPSRSEGLPTVLVEAGAANLPVVASAVGGIPDLLGNDRGFLLPDASADAISSVLRRLRNDPGEARARAARLHAFTEIPYDVDKNAARLSHLYAEVANQWGVRGNGLAPSIQK
ncbi:MAG: glycosyltransferase [Chloroflexota bacterium]|nr:glycosyltransferase [Chloroflexota bacterium]